jgi:glutathione S-transferase
VPKTSKTSFTQDGKQKRKEDDVHDQKTVACKRDGGPREISRLLSEKPFCVDNRFTRADIAVGSLLRGLIVRMSEFKWREKYPIWPIRMIG